MIRSFLSVASVVGLTFAAAHPLLWAQQGAVVQRPAQQDLIDKVVVPRAAVRAPGESRNATTMRLLRSKAEFKVEIMSLGNFTQFLSQRYKIPVRLDPSGLERAGVARSAPISAAISDIPLSAALKQILGRLDLDYRVVNGAIVISDRRPDPPVARNAGGRVVLHNGQAIIMQQGAGAGNVAPALREQALRQLGPLMDVELVFAKRIGGLDKDRAHTMRQELQDFVKDQVNEFFDLMQGRVAHTGGAFHLARKMLDDRLAAFIESHVSKNRAALYRQEVQKRDANEREVCALNLVVLLDRELSLTAKQRDAIQHALLENWDDGWSQVVEVGAMRGQNYVPSIPDELIENLLDATQVEVWENMQKIGSANWGFQVFRLGWFGMPVDELDKE